MTRENNISVTNICLTIPFSSTETAALAQEVLAVDKELKRSNVQREFSTDNANLVINFYGNELKKLRIAVNAALKNLLLIVKTIDQFS